MGTVLRLKVLSQCGGVTELLPAEAALFRSLSRVRTQVHLQVVRLPKPPTTHSARHAPPTPWQWRCGADSRGSRRVVHGLVSVELCFGLENHKAAATAEKRKLTRFAVLLDRQNIGGHAGTTETGGVR